MGIWNNNEGNANQNEKSPHIRMTIIFLKRNEKKVSVDEVEGFEKLELLYTAGGR